MNILVPVLKFGPSGGLRVLAKMSHEWVKLGHRVTFINMSDGKPYFPIDSEIVAIEATSTIQKYRKTIKYLNEHFQEYDCLLANFCLTTVPIIFSSLLHLNFKKNYYYIQAYEPDFFKPHTFKRMYAKLSYKLPFKRIVNSNIYRDYKKLQSTRVVFPGLDLLNYYSKDVKVFNPILKIGTIGRIEEWKGTADVCKAMEILQSENINFDFYLAFNDFETIPHHFVKPDGDEKLSAFYRDMDIVVAACKGQHGAIHYPVIETMAVGSTIVCTDYYPSNDSNAYKVDESAPEQIAEAIKRIINNKEEAIQKREQALKDVQQFDWPIVAQKFLNYLQEGSKDK